MDTFLSWEEKEKVLHELSFIIQMFFVGLPPASENGSL